MAEPLRLIATGVGATRDHKTGTVTMDLDTKSGPVHIDLTEEFTEALGLLLLDDPEHSDGSVPEEPLIDPDCRAGKCGSCVGGPCEHDCHQLAGRQS